MQKFDIVTYCSYNYHNILEISLPTWKNNSGCNYIYVYNDFINKIEDNVIYVRLFDENKDWLENVGRKVDTVISHIKDNDEYFVFLDADNYIRKDLNEAFIEDYDIAFTRMDDIINQEFTEMTVSASNFFVKNSKTDFFNKWKERTNLFKEQKIGYSENLTAYEQYALTDLIKEKINKYNIINLNRYIYNYECNNGIDEWRKLIRIHDSKIVHLKGKRILNYDFIKMVESIFLKNQSDLKDRNYLEKEYLPSLKGTILFVGVDWYTDHYHLLVKDPLLFTTIDIDPKKNIYGSPYNHFCEDFLKMTNDKKYDNICIYGLFGLSHLITDFLVIDMFYEKALKLLNDNGSLLIGSSSFAMDKNKLFNYLNSLNLQEKQIFLISSNIEDHPNYIVIGQKNGNS